MLTRWAAFTRFLSNGKICLTNNAAERALRCIAVGRKNWLFCGSDRGGDRAAAIYTLIGAARLNDIDAQAWLADVLAGSATSRSQGCTNSCPGTGVNPQPKSVKPPEPPLTVAFAG